MKEVSRLSAKDFYFCYSKEVSDLLSRNNIFYILKARSIKDGRVFTLYEKTDELSKLLAYDQVSKVY